MLMPPHSLTSTTHKAQLRQGTEHSTNTALRSCPYALDHSRHVVLVCRRVHRETDNQPNGAFIVRSFAAAPSTHPPPTAHRQHCALSFCRCPLSLRCFCSRPPNVHLPRPLLHGSAGSRIRHATRDLQCVACVASPSQTRRYVGRCRLCGAGLLLWALRAWRMNVDGVCQ